MNNQDIERAREYHSRTKHSPESVRRSAHYLDWSNQPLPFKIYSTLEPIPLPQEARPAGAAAPAPGLRDLAHLLHYSAGITRRRRYSGGELLFRAAACTGALYEIELYIVCGPLADLAAGVYHFGPADMALRRLREGDWRGVAAQATGRHAAVADAPAIVISTGTYWRNAWKYQARTYRHFGWDNGTLHANLLAVAAAQELAATVVCGFLDETINRLLDLDTEREVALAMVPLGRGSPAPEPPPAMPALGLATIPLSREEVDYPLMREMHAASSLATPEEVIAWGQEPAAGQTGRPTKDAIEEVILRRGSARRFSREPISLAHVSAILGHSTQPLPADWGPPLNELYLIVNAVDGLDPGAYVYHAAEQRLECLKRGEFRRHAAFLALEQDLPGDAAAAVFFLADLESVLGRLGNRGYRAVQLEAGILGGRIYLAAYGLRFGATGLTFYDDEVVKFFSPHAAAKSAIFLVAVGHPVRRPG